MNILNRKIFDKIKEETKGNLLLRKTNVKVIAYRYGGKVGPSPGTPGPSETPQNLFQHPDNFRRPEPLGTPRISLRRPVFLGM